MGSIITAKCNKCDFIKEGIKESCKQIQKETEKPKHKVRAKVEHMFALIITPPINRVNFIN